MVGMFPAVRAAKRRCRVIRVRADSPFRVGDQLEVRILVGRDTFLYSAAPADGDAAGW